MNKLTCLTAVAALLIACVAFAGCTGTDTVKTAAPSDVPTAQTDTTGQPDLDTAKIHKVVLLRHGESQWNKENRFTGWTDVDISEQGVKEAHSAGALRKQP